MLGMVRHPNGTIYLNSQRLGLYKSCDNGRTWTSSPVNLPDAPAGQKLHGLGVSRNGKLWLLHQRHGSELFISNSADGGRTWATARIDYANLAPGAPQQPYATSDNDYNSFVELPDETMMTAIELRYPEARDYQRNPSRSGFHETMIRSTDGGKTWSDPTSIHQFVAETSLTLDPNDPSHILAMTRIQRMLLPGEDRAAVESITGCTPGTAWPYKNGILLESTDGGRTFHEVEGGITEWYGHRGTIFWAPNDVVVIARSGSGGRVLAEISLDGGKTWVDGTNSGTSVFNQSKRFELVPSPPGHSFMTPTIELRSNHFLTAYAHLDAKSKSLAVSGVFWRLEPASGN